MPYISASIVIQLLGAVVPYFQRLQKEGEEGRKKIIQLTRYGTVLLAFLQSIGVSIFLTSYPGTSQGPLVPNSGFMFVLTTIIILVTGVIFVMWMGEQISDYGIGNGISLIIMVGIISRAPHVIAQQGRLFQEGVISGLFIIIMISFAILVTAFVVYVSTGVKIPVQYAKRVVGRKVYGGQASHIL